MPFAYMMLSVLCWSLFPLMSTWGIKQLSIFDYISWTYVIGFIATGIAFSILPARQKKGLPKIGKVTWPIVTEMFSGCLFVLLSFACLLMSFSYISRAGAVIIFESWPVMAIYLTPILLEKSWDKISRRDMLFSLLAFVGIAFFIVAAMRNPLFNQPLYHLFLPLMGGVLMAIASTIKSRVSHSLANNDYPIASLLKVQMVFSGGVVLLSVPFALLWPDKHSVYSAGGMIAILFTGIAIHTMGNISYTMAILRAAKPNILALWCLMPAFAVLWLWLAGQTDVTAPTVLMAIFITTASMMVAIKADRSLSYIATMTGILFCGVYVYFINGFGMEDYYQAISVPLFFYAILVAFMMDRLKKSDEIEEQLAVETINYLDEHADKIGAPARVLAGHVLSIVSTNDVAQVNAHYRAVRNHPDKHLRGIYNQLDHLALSKARGTNFSEIFVIFIVGALTMLSSIVYRPDNLIADGFAIVVPLSVIFVFFSVLDLSNDRSQFHLERDKEGRITLSQQITADLSGERIIAAVLILLILAAFGGLLWAKHGGIAR